MSRRARAIKRDIHPDAKYNSATVAKVINKVMICGKKSLSGRIVYGALDILEQQERKAPADILEQAVKNVTPLLMVKARRVGGATYQVPIEIQPDRGLTLAIRWLIKSARARTGKSMIEKLAAELSDASKGQGTTIKRRDDAHRMAEANRAFAHYRW